MCDIKKKKKGMVFIPYDYEAAYNKSIEDLHEFFVENMLKNRYRCVYACKEIRYGDQLAIEIYPEYKSMEDIPPTGRDNSKAQNNLNNKNSIKYVERLICENFTTEDIWLTLTYEDGREPKDEKEALKNIQNYIKRINYERKKRGLPNAKYVYITEYDPDADIRWHHHMIMDGFLDMDTVEKKWKKGKRNQVRRLEKDKYGLSGMAHYITKKKDRKKNEKRWGSSTGLRQFRVRKVYSKKKGGNGNYAPVSKYIDSFVRDKCARETELEKWYPEYDFLESNVYFNDFNGAFYVCARMRKRE